MFAGYCLESVGVEAVDTRDNLGRGRFFPFIPDHHVFGNKNKFWYWDYIYYPTELVKRKPFIFFYIVPIIYFIIM